MVTWLRQATEEFHHSHSVLFPPTQTHAISLTRLEVDVDDEQDKEQDNIDDDEAGGSGQERRESVETPTGNMLQDISGKTGPDVGPMDATPATTPGVTVPAGNISLLPDGLGQVLLGLGFEPSTNRGRTVLDKTFLTDEMY